MRIGVVVKHRTSRGYYSAQKLVECPPPAILPFAFSPFRDFAIASWMVDRGTNWGQP
jgi:hypothetical protein